MKFLFFIMIITVGSLFISLNYVDIAWGNLTLVPINSSIVGTPYANYTQEWWKWFMGIEDIPGKTSHPYEDTTGESCSTSQNGPVWFLSGSQVKDRRHVISQ